MLVGMASREPPDHVEASPNERIPPLPLPFQQLLLQNVLSTDALVILARGLGLLTLISHLLYTYDNPEITPLDTDKVYKNFVVMIGAETREETLVGQNMAELVTTHGGAGAGLQVVNTDKVGVDQRMKLYASGGIFSITSRILVVDLLTFPNLAESITGIVVMHAEKVIATSVEAFILRIFRQKNKNGFIKAFSDIPEPFTTGFSPLANMLKNLFLRNTLLWPRFQVDIATSLEPPSGSPPTVAELAIPLTPQMQKIQNALLECIEVCLSELKRSNPTLDMEDWTPDAALHRNFDVTIRRILDPIWHRVSWKTRTIVADLSLLRRILHYLLTYDAVSFNQLLETVLITNTPAPGSTRQNHSPWLFLDAAHTVFSVAKERVYLKERINSEESIALGQVPSGIKVILEELPKWGTLKEVLEEIEREIHFNPQNGKLLINLPDVDDGTNAVVVMCTDERTCKQLREYLQSSGTDVVMRRKLQEYFSWKSNFQMTRSQLFETKPENGKEDDGGEDPRLKMKRRGAPPNKRRRVRGGGPTTTRNAASGVIEIPDDDPADITQITTELHPAEIEEVDESQITFEDNSDDYFELYDNENVVVVLPYDGDMDDRILEEMKPRFVVMYEPNPAFIRRVEVYRASHPTRHLQAYFLYYANSVEEQRYLSAVRKEKDAFTRLIREKGNMALVIQSDIAVEDPQEFFLRTVNTRIAGGGRITATAEPPRVLPTSTFVLTKVVVDSREFRSSLPSLLHGRNLDVVPAMLTVGDYVLSPTMVVERKSVKDLIQSLNSGRLYNQCETMMQYYKTPLLLIEFDQNKSFNLEPFADMTGTINQTDLQSKLVLLTLSFPRLKIVWSSSPYFTAEVFEELKKNHEEPDPFTAVKIGLDPSETPGAKIYNQAPQEFLRSVPGVTAKNIHNLMMEWENIQAISLAPEGRLMEVVGPEAGRQIWGFFNKKLY